MTRPGIAFFDLDHTLIDTDCELTWKNMLADRGWVPEEQRERQQYYIDLHARGETPEKIRALQARGVPAVLLSGSNRILVTPIASALGISDLACTELQLVDGKYTGRIVGPFCIRGGKLNRAIEYCRLHSHDIGSVVFYGDSISDIPIFERVGQAVVVNPNETLKALARERNWRTISWELDLCSSIRTRTTGEQASWKKHE